MKPTSEFMRKYSVRDIEAAEGRLEQKDKVFLHMAGILGALGTCDRKRVGAIITYQGRCISWGFNGAPPGAPHCEENGHGYGYIDVEKCGCDILTICSQHSRLRREGCINATHAEANALAFAARSGISTESGTLYVTVSPCEVCARLLIAAGIKRVVYAEEYRDTRGIELLRSAGVEID